MTQMPAFGHQRSSYPAFGTPFAGQRRTPTYSQVVDLSLDRLRSGNASSRFVEDTPRFTVSR